MVFIGHQRWDIGQGIEGQHRHQKMEDVFGIKGRKKWV
jgi:hypothetical protein